MITTQDATQLRKLIVAWHEAENAHDRYLRDGGITKDGYAEEVKKAHTAINNLQNYIELLTESTGICK